MIIETLIGGAFAIAAELLYLKFRRPTVVAFDPDFIDAENVPYIEGYRFIPVRGLGTNVYKP
jgi:hypothetical protein